MIILTCLLMIALCWLGVGALYALLSGLGSLPTTAQMPLPRSMPAISASQRSLTDAIANLYTSSHTFAGLPASKPSNTGERRATDY